MNYIQRQHNLTIWILVGLVLAGCAGQPTTSVVQPSPTVEILAVEPTEVPPTATVVEPTLSPGATLAPPPPTRTPYPTRTPVPTIVFPELTGDYLGQELPGSTPVIFAPGIISTEMNERDIAISPDGNELFYSIVGKGFGVILWVRRVNGVWERPQLAPFSGVYSDQEPAFSPDGQRLFFASNRPQQGSGPDEPGFRIFYVERQADGWSSPQSVGEAINQGNSQFAPSVAADGTLYFTANYPEGKGYWDVYRSRLVNGVYQTPENLGAPINTVNYDHSPFIAPDQSYLIYGYNAVLYYIVRQQADGTWSKPKELSSSLALENQRLTWDMTLSPDGKVFFITSVTSSNPELPSAPPGFDAIIKQIGDTQKVSSLEEIPPLQGIKCDIYWLSAEALKGLED